MALSHEHIWPKISVKIKIYILSRAKLLCTVWDETPCITFLSTPPFSMVQSRYYQSGENQMIYLRLIDEKINHSDNEQPVPIWYLTNNEND